MPRLSAVGISGIHAGEDVKVPPVQAGPLPKVTRAFGHEEVFACHGDQVSGLVTRLRPGAAVRSFRRKQSLENLAFGERQLCVAHHCRQFPAINGHSQAIPTYDQGASR
jgi:hypothetical protein